MNEYLMYVTGADRFFKVWGSNAISAFESVFGDDIDLYDVYYPLDIGRINPKALVVIVNRATLEYTLYSLQPIYRDRKDNRGSFDTSVLKPKNGSFDTDIVNIYRNMYGMSVVNAI